MRSLGPFLRDAWMLAKPYFRSQERVSAWALLLTIIAMNLILVGMDVVLNYWNGEFYDALQAKDWNAFIGLLFTGHASEHLLGFMPGFCWIAAPYIAIAIYRTYLNQWLQIRWRRWMTSRFMDDWLADRAYYRIGLAADGQMGTDNPDQRIADDLRTFIGDQSTSGILSLGLDLLSNIVSLVAFVQILWTLSGAVTLWGIRIPGYMMWVAVLYALVGTFLTHLVGRPLSALNFLQQRYEADFRFALVRLRENAEGVALYGGEEEEKANLRRRFQFVIHNWWAIMSRTKALNALTSGYQQLAAIFPIVVAAPRYFAGQIPLGGLTRTSSAFGQVQGALSWFVGAYSSLAIWRATVERLATFHRAIEAARESQAATLTHGVSPTDNVQVRHLSIRLPNGHTLLDDVNLNIPAGCSTTITGRSGTGKSTLFRVLAGLWPFASGTVEHPGGQKLFLPQRPYVPLGTLRHAVSYPQDPAQFSDDSLRAALRDAGLEKLCTCLDEEAPWAQRLSGGEQQRLAIARALLLRPDWLFMDEATANLDPQAEQDVLNRLRERLHTTTIVAIGHRSEQSGPNDQQIHLV